jgi:hypothetical protein
VLRHDAAGEGQGAGAELSLTLSQIELNTTLGPRAFMVDVPSDARPITLEELRKSGPLGHGPGHGSGRGTK